MSSVAVVVGGWYRHEKLPHEAGVLHTAVPRSRQVDAVRFLNENAFATPLFFLDAEVLRRIEPTGFVDRIRTRQTAVLNALFQDFRLSRLAVEGAPLPAGPPYRLPLMFILLIVAVFADMVPARPPGVA